MEGVFLCDSKRLCSNERTILREKEILQGRSTIIFDFLYMCVGLSGPAPIQVYPDMKSIWDFF